VYGFTAIPFHLPRFLTPIVFALELSMKRLSAEVENFVAHKKESGVKYPINIGPFVIKKHATLQIVECVLKGMGFPESYAMNYDPKVFVY